jgi:hypothetical protein
MSAPKETNKAHIIGARDLQLQEAQDAQAQHQRNHKASATRRASISGVEVPISEEEEVSSDYAYESVTDIRTVVYSYHFLV